MTSSRWNPPTVVAVVAVLASVTTGAQAATRRPRTEPVYGTVSAPPEALTTLIDGVVQAIQSTFDALQHNAALAELGSVLLYSLFALVLAWNLVKALLHGDGLNAIVADLVPVMATVAVVTQVLDHGGIDSVIATMDLLASRFAGADVSSLDRAIRHALVTGFQCVVDVVSMPAVSSQFHWKLADAFAIMGWGIVSLLAKVVAAFFVIIAVGIYIAQITLALGSIYLAVALAPVMLPFILVPSLAWISNGWLRFFLGAGLIKVVGTFMLAFTHGLNEQMLNFAAYAAVPPSSHYEVVDQTVLVVLCGVVMLAFLSAYLMSQVPDLATGLLNGTAAGAGFKGLSALTGGLAARQGSAVLSGAVNSVARLGSRGAGAAYKSGADALRKARVAAPGGASSGLSGTTSSGGSALTPFPKLDRPDAGAAAR